MESTTRASVLTVEQCQCLLQVWNNITNALVFTGQATELSQALLHGARSVLNYDQATVNSARNRLAEVFAGASVAEIGQLQLSRLIAEISAALPRSATNNQQNIDTGHPNGDQGWRPDPSAGTDGSQTASVCPSNLLARSDRLVHECDTVDREGDTVMEQQDTPLCKLCTCETCIKRRDRAKQQGKKQNSLYTVANAFPRQDLLDILDKYWPTLQVHGLYPDRSCERFPWTVEINSPAYAQRRQYHLILRHLEPEDELHPWRRFVAEYKTLEGYNEFHREGTRQKFNGMQSRESGENDNNRANKEYVKHMFPDHSPEIFSEAKAALKYDLQFARRWAILINGFVKRDGSKIPGLGVGIFLVHGPEIKKKMSEISSESDL